MIVLNICVTRHVIWRTNMRHFMRTLLIDNLNIWAKVFNSELSKICGRQTLKI